MSIPECIPCFNYQVRSEKVTVSVSVSSKVSTLSLYTREAYTLTIRRHNTTTEVTILSSDFFGARHALETLSQLVDWDEHQRVLQVGEVYFVTCNLMQERVIRGLQVISPTSQFTHKSIRPYANSPTRHFAHI